MDLSAFRNSDEYRLEISGTMTTNTSNYKTDDLNLQFPISYSGDITKLDRELDLSITVDYCYNTYCDRCLDPVETCSTGKGRYILSGEDEEDFLRGDELDVDAVVMCTVITSLPHKVLCSPRCKGLCLSCGTNLNHEDCDCSQEMIDHRFAILQGLFEDKEV